MKNIDPSTVYVVSIVRNRYISKCIKENLSPAQLFQGLMDLNLNKSTDNIVNLKKHISNSYEVQWDESNNKWNKVEKIANVLLGNDTDDFSIFNNFKLPKTDSALIFKDVKEILTELKKITKGITVLLLKVDTISSTLAALTDVSDENIDESVYNE